MAIGSLPPVTNEIQANSGQPGKTLAQQLPASSLLDVQAAATAEPAVAIVPETTLIEKAVAEALGRQGGLAPLYATLAELAEAPDLPDAVKAAINTVLAFRLDDSNVTPRRVAEAIRSSGLFHEAVAAGKMAAVLPPAMRQALGGTPEEKRQASPRPATSLVSPVLTTRPTSPSPVVGGGIPSTSTLPPQNGSAVVTARGDASGPPAGAGSIPGAVGTATPSTVASGVSTPAATVSAPAGANALATGPLAPTLSPLSGGIPLPASAATIGVVSPLPTPSLDGDVGASASPQPPVGSAGSSPASPAAGGPVTATASVPASQTSPAGPATAQPAPASQPTGSVAQSASQQPPAPTPSPPATPSSQGDLSPTGTSGNGPASTRAFAPWTPGRPLVPSSPPPGPAMASSGSPQGEILPPGASSGLSPRGDAVPHRSGGDKALFVPSTVDSLPNVSPAATTRVQASPVTAASPEGAMQQGATQGASSGTSLPPASVGQPAGQAMTPQAASQQTRPGAAGTMEANRPAPLQTAQPATTPSAVAAPVLGLDLKGALTALRHELTAWLGRNADVMASLAGGGDEALGRADRPVPPRKGGPVRGQPATMLPDGDQTDAAATETLAGRALGEAERSLSRVFLHQAVTAESRDAKAAQPTHALVFEIPIAGPNGTSIAQLRIERDDHAPAESGAPPRRVFQVDIAFDIAPLGPVAVRVGLMDGRRVAVGVWCESDDGLVRMEAERENIVLGLEQEGMVVAGLDLHRGHPPEGREDTTVVANHRLDLQL